jgi:hypothetical protein
LAIEPDTQPDDPKRTNKALELQGYADRRTNELWHTPEGAPYMTVNVGPENSVLIEATDNSHPEHWPLARVNGPIRDWLTTLWFDQKHTPISTETLQQVERTQRAQAMRGKVHRIDTRLTWHDSCVYLDLMDEQWQVPQPVNRAGGPGLDLRPMRPQLNTGGRKVDAFILLKGNKRRDISGLAGGFVNLATLRPQMPIELAELLALLDYPKLGGSGESGLRSSWPSLDGRG